MNIKLYNIHICNIFQKKMYINKLLQIFNILNLNSDQHENVRSKIEKLIDNINT